MFWVKVNLDGVEHKMQTLALSAKDLEAPLRIFGGYMRKKALRKYQAQGFAPLADSTLAKRVSKGVHSMERKLARDVRRAHSRAAAGMSGGLGDVMAFASRGVRNRVAVLGEFQRRHPRMWKGRAAGMVASGAMRELSVKQLASLQARTQRAVDRAVGKPILGNLVNSLEVVVERGSMTLASRTAEEWSAVHNDGGSAGNNATIPKRETISVDGTDLEVLVSILKEHLLLPFQEGAHGPAY